MAALVARILTNGFRDVFPFLAAMWIAEAIWLTVTFLGLSALDTQLRHFLYYPQICGKYAGSAYLLFLAWRMWHAPVAVQDETAPPLYLFDGGLMVTLGNPKIMVFYVALLPTIIDLNRVTLSGWSILVGALFMILAGADMSWSFIAVRVWRLLKNRKAMRLANRSSAGMIEGAAVAIAAK